MKINILFLNLLICLIPLWTYAQTTNITTIGYGNKILVTGLIYSEYFYEQPNYDESPETDIIVGACLVKLDTTDNIVIKNNKRIEKLHLIFPAGKNVNCSILIGHRVQLDGVIEQSYTGHHHGDALFNVLTYKILR